MVRPASGNESDGQDHATKAAPDEGGTSAEQDPDAGNPEDDSLNRPVTGEKAIEQLETSKPPPASRAAAEDVVANKDETEEPEVPPSTEKDAAEHDEDHMVEGEEDTVIY